MNAQRRRPGMGLALLGLWLGGFLIGFAIAMIICQHKLGERREPKMENPVHRASSIESASVFAPVGSGSIAIARRPDWVGAY
jgi:hypothetical protein